MIRGLILQKIMANYFVALFISISMLAGSVIRQGINVSGTREESKLSSSRSITSTVTCCMHPLNWQGAKSVPS